MFAGFLFIVGCLVVTLEDSKSNAYYPSIWNFAPFMGAVIALVGFVLLCI